MYKVIAFYPNNLTKRQKKVSFMKKLCNKACSCHCYGKRYNK